MNTVQLVTETGTQLAMRQFHIFSHAERFAQMALGRVATNGETVARAIIFWEDGTYEEYEF